MRPSRNRPRLGEAGQRGGRVTLTQTNSEGAKADSKDSEDLGSGLSGVRIMGDMEEARHGDTNWAQRSQEWGELNRYYIRLMMAVIFIFMTRIYNSFICPHWIYISHFLCSRWLSCATF